MRQKKTFPIIYYVFAIYMSTLILGSTAISLSSSNFSAGIKLVRNLCYVIFVIKIALDLKQNSKITYRMIVIRSTFFAYISFYQK